MLRSFALGSAETSTLEGFAQRAGAAMACAFSSSDEFEAALIAERRAAGFYAPHRQFRQMLVTAAGGLSALAVLLYLIV